MGLRGLVMACYGGVEGILTKFIKSTDHPRNVRDSARLLIRTSYRNSTPYPRQAFPRQALGGQSKDS